MIKKLIFKTEIRNILLKHMEEGRVSPDQRLSLPTIAKELDVSVTPVREALTQLTESGIVTYKANRGFFVTELSWKDAKDIYSLIAVLESEAIRNSDFNPFQLKRLEQINAQFCEAKNAKEMVQLDRLFHETLIENFTNQYALKIIEDIRVRITMYEMQFMENLQNDTSSTMHNDILQYLANQDKDNAIKVLNSNWEISINHINKTLQNEMH